MKNLLTLLFILPFIVFSQKSVIGKPYNLNGLEIAQFDFTQPMNYEEATEACSKLGDGWRLPTKEELNILYQNKDKIGGFANKYYWSSTEDGSGNVWWQDFGDGYQNVYYKGANDYVRAVRAF